VTATFLLAGDVASFDEAGFRMALLARFADAADVLLAVSTASVRVVATLLLPSASAAARVAREIATTPMATMERSWFASVNGRAGVTLESPPTAQVVAQHLPLPPPAPPTFIVQGQWAKTEAIVVLLFSGAIGALLVTGGVCLLRRQLYRRRQRQPDPDTKVVDAPVTLELAARGKCTSRCTSWRVSPAPQAMAEDVHGATEPVHRPQLPQEAIGGANPQLLPTQPHLSAQQPAPPSVQPSHLVQPGPQLAIGSSRLPPLERTPSVPAILTAPSSPAATPRTVQFM